MSSVIDNPIIKDKCQTFTPNDIVGKMLDLSGYAKNIYGKKILENSCGDGQILVQIVTRYIDEGKRLKLSNSKIKLGLETDIYGYEIDKKLISQCISSLNAIAYKYKIKNVKWNIKCEDFTRANISTKFNYIIGNPPYIAYPDLPDEVQKYIKTTFLTCKKGKFDYSYAFIEKSYNLLDSNGILVYIIPSNIFKNVFANSLRNLILSDIDEIIDYPKDRIFNNVLVSPAIIKVIKGLNNNRIIYTNMSNKQKSKKNIYKSQFHDKWIFDKIPIQKFNTIRVGDYFKVSSSVATLLNKAFIFKPDRDDNNYYYVGKYKIEKNVAKKAASPKSKKYNKHQDYIIFPYYYEANNMLKRYDVEEFAHKFPFAFQYLNHFKPDLDKRQADKNAKWYEYGRSQALQNINQKKLLISSVISECTKAYMLDIDEIPYSGLYIIAKGNISLDNLCLNLNSNEFKSYISKVGVCVNGTSKRITPRDIENYIY